MKFKAIVLLMSFFTMLIFAEKTEEISHQNINDKKPTENLREAIEQGRDLKGKKIRITITKALPEVINYIGAGDMHHLALAYDEYLKGQGADVIVDVPKLLKDLYRRTSKLTLSDDVSNADQYEKIELADLYDSLRNEVPNFQRTTSLLQCSDENILKAHNFINQKTNGKLIPVLIFTSGNVAHNEHRFAPTKDWNDLTKNSDGLVFFNCQFGGDDIKNSIRPSELDKNFDEKPFEHTPEWIAAAVLLNNGVVISHDTGTLHLAATILEGKNGTQDSVLCPMTEYSDQRWRGEYMKNIAIKDRVKINKTCWYPKSLLVFQQMEPGNWQPVMKQIGEHLNELVLKFRSASQQ